MADEDLKKKEEEGTEPEQGEEASESDAPIKATKASASVNDEASADDQLPADVKEAEAAAEGEAAPATGLQLGWKRFVYGAYFGGAIAVAFVAEKAISTIWHRLGTWKPQLGEAKDEYVLPIAAIIGVGTALYYWRREKTRTYVEQVAEELSKVTWPSRKEVQNSTFVVIVTTAFATVFFALMDQFWRYVTNLVYGF